MSVSKDKIAIVGLGYVGLPLAVEFSKVLPVIGYDIDAERIVQLKKYFDKTLEITELELKSAKSLLLTNEAEDIRSANIYIITVPTPIDGNNRPDLKPLISATELVAGFLCEGDIVIYESTVYPGATEEVCVPLLEKISRLKFNENFFCGYSPERINPGDKIHRLTEIVKVTSGSNDYSAEKVDSLYSRIIKAGTYKAESIRVAEAAKVIENTQRDLNIALMNELSIVFDKLGIDTEAVLLAAQTKWNFLPFKPGLVGGHCIGVDPYYLTHKAEELGYHPEVILAGRRINDSMSKFVSEKMIRALCLSGITVLNSKILIMGLTFKENCPDLRNTKVIDIVTELKEFGVVVAVADPRADAIVCKNEFGFDLVEPELNAYDGVIIAVNHDDFLDTERWYPRKFLKPNGVVVDVKSMYTRSEGFIRL